MAKNDDGEFELILGNRQLLSVFFIVVILLGVFFTMGYIVGRNSAPVGASDVVAHKEAKPVVVDSPSQPAPAPPAEAPREPSSDSAATKPQQSVESDPPKTAMVKTRTSGAGQPTPGEVYLQLAATSQHEAEVEVDVLRKKGFKALSAEIAEKPGTFRVLVGPVVDLNKARSDLQSAGFPGREAIRRMF